MGNHLHNIDQLFKAAIDPHEDPPSEKVWTGIENELDKGSAEKYKRKIGFLKTMIFLLGILLLFSVMYEMYENKGSQKSSSNIRGVDIHIDTPAHLLPKKEFSNIEKKGSDLFNVRRNDRSGSGSRSDLAISLSGKRESVGPLQVKITPITHTIKNLPFTISYDSPDNEIKSEMAADSTFSIRRSDEHQNIFMTDSKRGNRKQKFSLWLMSGPDWSTVKFDKWTKPGLDFGLMIGYRFAPLWNVKTGILLSGKDYKSNAEDFEPVNNSPNDDLNEVSANCRVINLPVTIGYRFLNNGHSRMAVNLGVASYWFMSEEYTYHYKRISGIADRDWEFQNINKNLLSIITASVDYQYFFSKGFGFSVTPFFQEPVSKVGYGRVNMQSIGLYMGAVYHF